MKWSELFLLLIIGGVSALLLKDSFDLSYQAGQSFGAGFVPRNIAVITLVVCAILGVRLFAQRAKTAEGNFSIHTILPAVVTIILLLIATYFMKFGSVLLPLGIVITIVSSVFLKHSWLKSVVLTLVTLAVLYAIFALWLKIPVI